MSETLLIFLTANPTLTHGDGVPKESMNRLWRCVRYCHERDIFIDILISTYCQVPGKFRYSRHLNKALAAAVCPKHQDIKYVIQMSDDVLLPDEGALYRMISEMKAYGKPALFGVRQYSSTHLDNEVPPGYMFNKETMDVDINASVAAMMDFDKADYYLDYDYLTFSIIGMSIEALRSGGMLDDRFEFYSEDADYCLKLKYKLGIPLVLLTNCAVTHIGELTWRDHPHKNGSMERGKDLLKKKWQNWFRGGDDP